MCLFFALSVSEPLSRNAVTSLLSPVAATGLGGMSVASSWSVTNSAAQKMLVECDRVLAHAVLVWHKDQEKSFAAESLNPFPVFLSVQAHESNIKYHMPVGCHSWVLCYEHVSHCFLQAQGLDGTAGSLGHSADDEEHAGRLQQGGGAACGGHGRHVLPAPLHRVVALHGAQGGWLVPCTHDTNTIC